MNLFEDLKWRGLIKDMSNEEEIRRVLTEEKVTFYWGTDPSGDSLHLGHFSSLLLAKRLANAGHHPILLVGGATGLIGDPRPTLERSMQSVDAINKNYETIHKQITNLFGYEMVNNYDWSKDISFIEFLRDYGKFFNINYMLDKDIVKRRLETGITYAEFSYMIMQALDFLYLYENKNCILQVEGSDQWGNITAGIDLIRKKTGKEALGFTMPLILDKDGNKFGKSEGNALWLDKDKTKPYEMYQYLINTDDSIIIHYLKIFTFLSREEIEELEIDLKEHPENRKAQKTLAKEVIVFLHGEEYYKSCVNASENLFKADITSLSVEEIMSSLKDVPTFEVENEEILGVDFLVKYNICTSKREAREMISAGAITINDMKLNDFETHIVKETALERKLLVIRKGKKKYYLGIYN